MSEQKHSSARGKRRRAGRRTRRSGKAESPPGRFRRWALRIGLGLPAAVVLWIFALGYVNPPITPYMAAEALRRGGVDRAWVPMSRIAPVMARSVVAAEDANFCLHWGFDMAAIRLAIDEGSGRGASTISQQAVKNVFLWQGRSWIRKALEAMLTPVVEAFWSKRRILEVYLNVAEFGDGVFGVEAAARHYYGVPAAELSPRRAARLAVLLPNPKARDPNALPAWLGRLASRVADGAETIRADGRAACFES